jgi:hypothetical protein
MSFNDERKKYSKEHFWYVELDIDGATYRFCENVSPLPLGFDGVPTLETIRTAPAEIDLSGGIGVRAKLSVTISEHMDYSFYGTVTNPVRFWSRWRAENPYYLGRSIRAYSGYIVDGAFDPANFQQRNYITEGFTQTGKGVSITGKDVLKLASDDRAQAPRESNGLLIIDILDTTTTITLQPSGVGSEYPASGFARLGDEVVSFTRSGDVFTLTRGQFNTVATEHSQDDVFQLCLRYDGQEVDNIIYDLLVNYANVDPAFIDTAAWQAEESNAFTTTYSTLITEPTGVKTLLKELGESAPHYLYWDERVNQIRFVAIKQPPESAYGIRYDSSILEGSFAVKDMQDMRISTVIVNFGLFDPTKDLDESSNYRQTYVREDTDSVNNYGQRAIKTINSRWINNDNKTAAVLASARTGRRFAEAPRKVQFQVDAKDAEVWTGDDIQLTSDIIEQAGGGFATLPYQIISVQETRNYSYVALEHTYGASVPGDDDAEDPNVRLIYINGEQDQLRDDLGNTRTLRELYDDVYPADFVSTHDIRFIFEPSCVAGSSDAAFPAINTGSFAGLITPPLLDVRGVVVGKGGDGATVDGVAGNGGVAINMTNPLRIDNSGVIGGGGGGGGYARTATPGGECAGAGGGGAGYTNGLAGGGTFATGADPLTVLPQNGTNTSLGSGSNATVGGVEPGAAIGGNGGALGQDGVAGFDGNVANSAGGTGGAAINQNGNAITWINAGDVQGAINT